MREPAGEMGIALRETPVGHFAKPVYANVTAEVITDPASVSDLLEKQLASPVRWTETVQNMAAAGVDTIIEFGVGEVLCGLIRRIDKGIRTAAVNDMANLNAARDLVSA
jgi:[acyl-carrier-protein] S-malonyltransferase